MQTHTRTHARTYARTHAHTHAHTHTVQGQVQEFDKKRGGGYIRKINVSPGGKIIQVLLGIIFKQLVGIGRLGFIEFGSINYTLSLVSGSWKSLNFLEIQHLNPSLLS